MIRRLLAAFALALVAASAPSAQETEEVHTFELRDGDIYLDGRLLPDAVPPGLDLSGFAMTPLEFSGPIAPVLEIDSQAYVLEDERLVPMNESSRPDRGVYIMGDVVPTEANGMLEARAAPSVEAEYMRDVASRDEAMTARMERAVGMQQEADGLAARVRTMPEGPQRTQLRTQLRALLSDLLDLHHDIRDAELDVADQLLDSARTELADRRAHHDDIVEKRLRELLGSE